MVRVDDSLRPESDRFTLVEQQNVDQIEIITAQYYSDLQKLLDKPWIIEVVAIIRGRAIPFQEQRKMKFF